jgi:hypothetical protein
MQYSPILFPKSQKQLAKLFTCWDELFLGFEVTEDVFDLETARGAIPLSPGKIYKDRFYQSIK